MANYLPFNSIDADRAVKAEDWAWYFSTFIGNGVFPNPSNGLQVMANGNMQIAVKPGFGYINGYAFKNPEDTLFTISVADGVLDRIDRVVLRWDLSNRVMELAVKLGTPSASPVAPALVRQADMYELALADISVTHGLTIVTQAHITDQRFNTSLCGIVTGLVTQIDASALTAQFSSFFTQYSNQISADYNAYVQEISGYEDNFESTADAWMAQQTADFTAWVQSLHDIIDEEVAAQLAAMALEHESRLSNLEHMVIQDHITAPINLEEDPEETPILLVDEEGAAIVAEWQYETI